LPIAEILAPVIALAENGVVVTEFKHKAANYRETFIKLMVPTACFLKYTRQVDTIKYPAATLKQLQKMA
jgi:gamma-glutamyltranspeptidase/glutathione hydrolase